MSTAKSLQKPKIIEIIGSTIRVAHPTTTHNNRTYVSTPLTAAGTTLTVADNNGFADDDWFVLGEIGDNQTEECDVNGAVTRGTSMTITNSTKFNHQLHAPVTKIFERGIKIYGAATDGGAGTLIASVDAITTPIADAVMIQWNKPYTEYTLISTDTSYSYYFVKFTDGTTDSAASTYVPSTGLTSTKIETLIQQALDITNTRIDGKRLTREMFVNWANDCQDAITQFVWQDSRTGLYQQKDWSFEVIRDSTSITLSEGEDSYALSGLTYAMKYPNSDKSVMVVQVGSEPPLREIAIKDFDLLRANMGRTDMNGTGAVGATSITVDSTGDFSSSGSLVIGSQTITYTGTTSTTFTGIPASGSGSITTLIADNTPVWQNVTLCEPTRYVIFNGRIYFDYPPSSTFAGLNVKIRYLKALDRLTSVSDGTSVPFTNVYPMYFSSMIFYRIGQTDEGAKWMNDFNKQVLANAQADFIPVNDDWRYYNFADDIYDETVDDENPYYYY